MFPTKQNGQNTNMEDNSKQEQLQYHYHEILKLLGEDVNREGLVKTPLRVAKAMQTLTRGYEMDPEAVLNSAKFSEPYNQMVIVKERYQLLLFV